MLPKLLKILLVVRFTMSEKYHNCSGKPLYLAIRVWIIFRLVDVLNSKTDAGDCENLAKELSTVFRKQVN